MAINKIVKVRKEHKCHMCGDVIKKGEYANYIAFKSPKYDYAKDTQIGITYINIWYCIECNNNPHF